MFNIFGEVCTYLPHGYFINVDPNYLNIETRRQGIIYSFYLINVHMYQ